jgi:hypothetical protein
MFAPGACRCPLTCDNHPDEGSQQESYQIDLSYLAPSAQSFVSIGAGGASFRILLADHDIVVDPDVANGQVILRTPGYNITLQAEILPALAYELLKQKRVLDLTNPDSVESTIETLRSRLGSDLAPLADSIAELLRKQSGVE